MHRNLTDILADIDTATETANQDLSDVPARLQGAWQMAVREAKEAVVALTEEYSKALLANTAGLFAAGEPTKCAQFSKLSASECGTLTVHVDELYVQMAQEVEPTLGARREFGINQLAIVVRQMRDTGNRLKLTGSLAIPRVPETLVVETTEDVVACIKKLVTESNGHGLMVEFTKQAIIDRGLHAKYSDKTTRVVILGTGEPEALALKNTFRSRRIVTITPETVVDESFAIATVEGRKSAEKAAKSPPKPDGSKPPEAPPAAPVAAAGATNTDSTKESK